MVKVYLYLTEEAMRNYQYPIKELNINHSYIVNMNVGDRLFKDDISYIIKYKNLCLDENYLYIKAVME